MHRLRRLLRALIREHIVTVPKSQRLSFDDMAPLLNDLDEKLQSGRISMSEYDAEHSDILKAAGWSPLEFEREVDRRWDFVDQLRAVPPKVRYQN